MKFKDVAAFPFKYSYSGFGSSKTRGGPWQAALCRSVFSHRPYVLLCFHQACSGLHSLTQWSTFWLCWLPALDTMKNTLFSIRDYEFSYFIYQNTGNNVEKHIFLHLSRHGIYYNPIPHFFILFHAAEYDLTRQNTKRHELLLWLEYNLQRRKKGYTRLKMLLTMLRLKIFPKLVHFLLFPTITSSNARCRICVKRK